MPRRQLERPITAAELAARLGAACEGDAQVEISAVASLASAGSGDLAYVAEKRHLATAREQPASALIVSDGQGDWQAQARLVHAQPRLAFAKALQELFPPDPVTPGVSERACVAASARVVGARIEALAHVGSETSVGRGSLIHPHAFIGSRVRIGQDCVIHPQVAIYDDVELGDRVIVHAGTIIGADGFGFERDAQAGWCKLPQLGSVRIGDDVEIGAGCTIDRGALDDTVIGAGVKIDDQVHIAHNCVIGARTIIAGCAGIAGSTTIGEDCMIGGAAMIVGHISICAGCMISGGTLIMKSIDRPGRYTGVFPAGEHQDWVKMAASLRRGHRR